MLGIRSSVIPVRLAPQIRQKSTARPVAPSLNKPRPRRTTAAPPPPPVPEKVEPDIVYEDEKFLVINKPNGLALQGQYGSPARKLWDDLFEAIKSRPESPEVFPVHRLDKATTGTLLLAKSQLQAARLSQQLAKHEIDRRYLAVVYGELKVGFKGTVQEQLRVDEDKVRIARGREGEPEGVDARTDWECVAASPSYSLLSLSPSTGRKHQLRVHLAECLKAPIVGDFKYSPDSPHFQTLSELSIPTTTTLLHASQISFHAWQKNGKRQTIEAFAPVPPAFERFCRAHKLKLPM
ncbi:hypothetical protein JCM16303_004545 [Sporobolomyces ruberrimus]